MQPPNNQELHNPALEFFLHDLRSTLTQQPGNQTQIQRIVDNLQYIVSKQSDEKAELPRLVSHNSDSKQTPSKQEPEKISIESNKNENGKRPQESSVVDIKKKFHEEMENKDQ